MADVTTGRGDRFGPASGSVDSELGCHERRTPLVRAQSVRRMMGTLQPPMAVRVMGDPVWAARAAIDAAGDNALSEGQIVDLENSARFGDWT